MGLKRFIDIETHFDIESNGFESIDIKTCFDIGNDEFKAIYKHCLTTIYNEMPYDASIQVIVFLRY